ncbi:hypothetical protein HDV06_005599 [Boothiomyces sp. JEL0866]|nr:hypothetical protein HDV06_005599 [Boothiomyces sp. JEL0866]
MDMEQLLTRCNICFDAHLDFCLPNCRDQFCFQCFNKYIKTQVTNSWGLSVQKICCPACSTTLSQSDWEDFVDEDVVDLYEHYNRPYRPLTRTCENCQINEIYATPTPKIDKVSRKL